MKAKPKPSKPVPAPEKKPVYYFTVVLLPSKEKLKPMTTEQVNEFIRTDKHKFEVLNSKNQVVIRKIFKG